LTVSVFNTLSQRKDEIAGRTAYPHNLNLYVCGPTVYDSPHIGHARSYIIFDTLRRVLLLDGYRVRYMQNFSDVDEKIDARAVREGTSPDAIADRYTDEFLSSMDGMGVMRADDYPSVRKSRLQMYSFVNRLIERGLAYEAGSNIYFDTARGGGFGALLHGRLEDIISGNEADTFKFVKRRKEDFTVWLGPLSREPSGGGRPSWNVECFTMTHTLVGCGLDIQCGGKDLIFPHHEVGSVISRAFCGVEFANYYIHNGFVTVSNDKMSKSKSNSIALQPFLENRSYALRMYLLSSHFSENIEYSSSDLGIWEQRAARIMKKFDAADSGRMEFLTVDGMPRDQKLQFFMELMRDNLRSDRAISTFIDYALERNGTRADEDVLHYMAAALGLFNYAPSS